MVRKRAKKINGVSGIMEKSEIKRMYEGVFDAVKHAIAINLYTDYASLGDVLILNGENEVARLDYEDYDYEEMIRETKKQLVKNNLYVTEIVAEPNTLVLYTDNDLLSLIFVPEFDEEDYCSIELAKIQCEIEQENEPQEQDWQHSTDWKYYESKALEKAVVGKDEDDVKPAIF